MGRYILFDICKNQHSLMGKIDPSFIHGYIYDKMGGAKMRRILLSCLSVLWAFQAPAIAEDVLAKADLAYGEYLSGECVTCHRADGGDDGIPSITGLDAEGFIYMMHAYRTKELENKVMQLVAGRLDDEQIASLAVYFATLPPAKD